MPHPGPPCALRVARVSPSAPAVIAAVSHRELFVAARVRPLCLASPVLPAPRAPWPLWGPSSLQLQVPR
eukprot:2260205-Lingulodinium_polyedra.AAC.1